MKNPEILRNLIRDTFEIGSQIMDYMDRVQKWELSIEELHDLVEKAALSRGWEDFAQQDIIAEGVIYIMAPLGMLEDVNLLSDYFVKVANEVMLKVKLGKVDEPLLSFVYRKAKELGCQDEQALSIQFAFQEIISKTP